MCVDTKIREFSDLEKRIEIKFKTFHSGTTSLHLAQIKIPIKSKHNFSPRSNFSWVLLVDGQALRFDRFYYKGRAHEDDEKTP